MYFDGVPPPQSHRLGAAVIQLYYWRKHLPTDTVYIGTFTSRKEAQAAAA